MEKDHDKQKLEEFFREVAELTLNHDVLGDSAVVYPNKLGKALEKVDSEWCMYRTDHWGECEWSDFYDSIYEDITEKEWWQIFECVDFL